MTATHCNCNTLVSLQRPDDLRMQILANTTGEWLNVEQAHCNKVQLRHTVITTTQCNDYECNTLGLCYIHMTATHCNCNTLVSL